MDKESRNNIIRISIIAIMFLITMLVDLTNWFSSEIQTIVSITNIVVDVVVVAFAFIGYLKFRKELKEGYEHHRRD